MPFSWTWTEASLGEMDPEIGMVLVLVMVMVMVMVLDPVNCGDHLYEQLKRYSPIQNNLDNFFLTKWWR